MSWYLLHVMREKFQKSAMRGRMYLRTLEGGWEELCYSYELPWVPDKDGKSTKSKSCIEGGIYLMRHRSDGPKGWSCWAQSTARIFRFIEHARRCTLKAASCRLRSKGNSKKGDLKIKEESIALNRIRQRYEAFAADSKYVTIKGSVGDARAKNDPLDVRAIQTLLIRAKLLAPLQSHPLATMISAIRKFQSEFMSSPDGRVDVNGNTFKRLAALAMLKSPKAGVEGKPNIAISRLLPASHTTTAAAYA